MSDELLWPARNIAEYAYCPRLFYYMQVEGIYLPSSDTEKGRAVHRRVDKPSASTAVSESESQENEPPVTIRSFVLSSRELELTATLDLTEISGKNASPVEYRKGRPKRAGKTQSSDNSEEIQVEP